MENEVSIPVAKEELQRVLNTMIRYSRHSGYMGKKDAEDPLRFYDSNPDFGGAFVTREDLVGWIEDFGK